MKRIHFIGSGYESIKSIIVDAETFGEAIRKALDIYAKNGWKFHYIAVDIEPLEF